MLKMYDSISININGEYFTAEVVDIQKKKNRATWIFTEPIATSTMKMVKGKKFCYKNSEGAQILHRMEEKILEQVPAPQLFKDGSFLKLPSEIEFFGAQYVGIESEGHHLKGLTHIDKRKSSNWCWLRTLYLNSPSAYFCHAVGGGGASGCWCASLSGGLRPIFRTDADINLCEFLKD